MIVKASYFLGTRLLGTSQFPSGPCTPYNEAFFCRTCGDIWARVVIAERNSDGFHLNHVPCAAHRPSAVSDWSAFPGSVLPNSLTTAQTSCLSWAVTLENIPEPVLQREFHLAVQHFERTQNRDNLNIRIPQNV